MTFKLRVCSSSMSPFVKADDEVIVKRYKLSDLRNGDIIVFSKYQDLYVHRLVSSKVIKDKVSLLTKGDSSRIFDEPLNQEDFLGKVIQIHRKTQSINLENWFWKTVNRCISFLSYSEAAVYKIYTHFKKLILIH